MIKKVILDKADRLYHFPFDMEDFFPKRTIKTGERRIPTLDLGHFNWPHKNGKPDCGSNFLASASPNDIARLKESLSGWLNGEYRMAVDPRKEIYIGQGIHRIIFDLYLAFVELGDIVLCPEPGMPFYRRLAIAVGGVPVTYPISAKSNYKPSAVTLSSNLGKTAKILILNNPNNPFGTVLDDTELAETIRIASRQNTFIINDAAYCSLAPEKYRPLRSLPGGGKVSLEIYSIPFTFGLPYLPFGFAVGPSDVINGLETIGKTLGVSIPAVWVDQAMKSIAAYPSEGLREIKRKIDNTRLEAEQLVEKMEWKVIGEKSSPFLWIKIPERKQAASYAAAILRRKHILTLPGTAFGETGEGHLRLSLTATPDEYREATARLMRKLTIKAISGEK
nr:pyridoxal phosphate-dependent aminotransferase [candidate division Zixibacteria bacterium]